MNLFDVSPNKNNTKIKGLSLTVEALEVLQLLSPAARSKGRFLSLLLVQELERRQVATTKDMSGAAR